MFVVVVGDRQKIEAGLQGLNLGKIYATRTVVAAPVRGAQDRETESWARAYTRLKRKSPSRPQKNAAETGRPFWIVRLASPALHP
jgi:hypothetical protein